MPYTIEKLADAPIIITHPQQGDGTHKEMANAIAELSAMLDAQTESVFLIIDMRDVSMDLDDIVRAASMSARGRDAMLHHPNLRESIYVLTDTLIKTAVKGLESATFGQLRPRVFDTLEEALNYCHGQTATPGF